MLSEYEIFGCDEDGDGSSVCSLPTFNYGGMAAAAVPSQVSNPSPVSRRVSDGVRSCGGVVEAQPSSEPGPSGTSAGISSCNGGSRGVDIFQRSNSVPLLSRSAGILGSLRFADSEQILC